MWAWSGAKKVLLYIVLLEFIIGRLAIERVEAIGRLEFIIGPRLEFIGRLECVNGRLECVDPLVIGQLATEPPEFIVGLPAIEQLESIGRLDSRKADHA